MIQNSIRNMKHRATSPRVSALAFDSRYEVILARGAREIASAMELRHRVFSVELGASNRSGSNLEFDEFDFRCEQLIAVDQITGRTIGTYRLNSGLGSDSYYSYQEFEIEKLPQEILFNAVEIGRACIGSEHRNSKVLFLLWKALLAHLKSLGKRYFFGCSSIFSKDPEVGRSAYLKLQSGGHLHEQIQIAPRRNAINIHSSSSTREIDLPALFDMYLRIGAKVCGPPMIDHEFGTIDFFMLMDIENLSDRYRKMFA
jgi:putative hemolysin